MNTEIPRLASAFGPVDFSVRMNYDPCPSFIFAVGLAIRYLAPSNHNEPGALYVDPLNRFISYCSFFRRRRCPACTSGAFRE